MKVIEAYWEKRNLNLTTTEVLIEQGDSLKVIANILESLQSEYVVVKVPIENIQAAFLLERLGYSFIEAMTHNEHCMETKGLNPNNKVLTNQILMKKAEKEDIEKIYFYIRNGLYSTDRVSLDPYFTKEIANRRYVGWLGDELNRGMILYVFTFQKEDFGFIALKEEAQGVYRNVLYGVYPVFQGQGLASCLMYKTIETLKKMGCHRLLVDISSNNLASLKCCHQCGFQITDFSYTFVKHN